MSGTWYSSTSSSESSDSDSSSYRFTDSDSGSGSDSDSGSDSSGSDSESDSSVSNSDSKRLKRSYGGIDRISPLPDGILPYLLSFLHMKDAIKTSLISSRWRSLWKSNPTLNFRGIEDSRRQKFVERVFLLRSDSNVQKLCLHCSCSVNLHVWMTFAVERQVQELHLKYKANTTGDVFPDFMHTSTIKVLKLSCTPYNQMEVPVSVCSAHQLNSLDLAYVQLPYVDSEYRLILSSKKLENLSIRNCKYNHLHALNIVAPNLKKLLLENHKGKYDDRINSCVVQVSTHSLVLLVMKGMLYRDYLLENLSSLVTAKFEASEPVPLQILIKVVNGLYNAATLELSGKSQEVSGESLDSWNQPLNSFFNLTTLKITRWSGGCSHISTLTSLLTNSPFIENIFVRMDQIMMNHKKRDWRELFQCIFRMRSIEIQDIKGTADELKLCAFLIKTAISLEEFTLTLNESPSRIRRKELAEFNMKIHSLPRASSRVKIFLLPQRWKNL